MTSLAFFVPGIPVTQGSKTVFRGRVVESAKGLKAWRQTVAEYVMVLRGTKGLRQPLTGALQLSCAFQFARPKRPANPYPALDLDKLVRAIGDALKVGQLIGDDRQLTTFHQITKRYCEPGDEPGVRITLTDDPWF